MTALKIVLGVALTVGAFCLCYVVALLALRTFGEITGFALLLDYLPVWAALLAVALIPAPVRSLPIPFRSAGTADVAAPASAVWPLVRPVPGQPYHAAMFDRVAPIAGDGSEVMLCVNDTVRAANPAMPAALHAVIEEEQPLRKISLRFRNAHAFPGVIRDLVRNDVLIEPVDANRCQVTVVDHLARLRLSSLRFVMRHTPCREAAERLAALAEGRHDAAWTGRSGAGRPGLFGRHAART